MSGLILSGWAQPSDALAAIAPEAAVFDYSDYTSPEASFSGLEKFKHTKCVVAWSMGGQLALRAIAAGVLAPQHLTLIAPPYQFVGAQGMDVFTFEQFRNNYAQNPARTKARFHALVAKGDTDFSRVLDGLAHHPEVENPARWLPWLDDLGAYSLDDAQLAALPPTLLVHGMEDAIVPVAQGLRLMERFPTIQRSVWENAGHAPHVHDAARLRAEIAAHRGRQKVAA